MATPFSYTQFTCRIWMGYREGAKDARVCTADTRHLDHPVLHGYCTLSMIIKPVMKKIFKCKKVGMEKSNETRWDEMIIVNYSDNFK